MSPNKDKKDIVIQELDSYKLGQLSNNLIADLNEEDTLGDISSPTYETKKKLRGRTKRKSADDNKINNVASIITKLSENDQKKSWKI